MSPQKLGQVLRRFREAKGLSQRELAAKAKVTGAYVAQLETGTKKNPSLAILQRLARALGVSVTELVG